MNHLADSLSVNARVINEVVRKCIGLNDKHVIYILEKKRQTHEQKVDMSTGKKISYVQSCENWRVGVSGYT